MSKSDISGRSHACKCIYHPNHQCNEDAGSCIFREKKFHEALTVNLSATSGSHIWRETDGPVLHVKVIESSTHNLWELRGSSGCHHFCSWVMGLWNSRLKTMEGCGQQRLWVWTAAISPGRLMHTVALAVIVEWMESNAKGMATLEVELETALLWHHERFRVITWSVTKRFVFK